jgi:hypothetical protein
MSVFSRLLAPIAPLLSNKHFRYGLPFISLLLGATFTLREVRQGRYDFSKVKSIDPKDLEALGIEGEVKSPPIEEVYDEYMKKDFKEDYEMVRGPRPWEEDSSERAKNNPKLPRPVRTF